MATAVVAMRDVVAGVVAGLLGAGSLGAGCVVDDGPDGASGAKGKVIFQADPDLVFASPVAVGSTFRVVALAKSDEVELSDAAVLVVDGSGDATVVAVEGEALTFDVTLTAPGKVALVLDDGGAVDTITVDARTVGESALVDAKLLEASEVVDARLPQRFAVLDDQPTRLLISAVDSCGAGVLDLGASSVVVVGEDGVDPATLATISADGPAAFVLEPVDGATGFTIELHTVTGVATDGGAGASELAVLSYDVDVVARGAVDEVHAEVASVDTQSGSARLWGRGFVDDIDVVGLDFGWSGDARVLLDRSTGAAAVATISFPEDGTVDERPAVVRAEVFGTEGFSDLLSLTAEELITARGGAPKRPAPEPVEAPAAETGDACSGGGGTCVAAVGAAWALGRRQKPRRRR